MRWIAICCLAIVLTAIVCAPVAAAVAAPDYEKIVQIRLNHQGDRYTVASMEVRYGKAPNLNIRSGDLKGIILDTQGRELKSFSFQESGVTYGDILGPPGGDSLIGYTERPAPGDLIITMPYLQDMQTFTLSNSRDGSLLASANINPALTAFCADYANDPDCLHFSSQAQTAPQEYPAGAAAGTTINFTQVAALALLVIAILSAYILMRSRAKTAAPARQRVLVVDDEPLIVDLVTVLLQEQDYSVQSATGGRECLDMIRKMKDLPDVILLDVMMQPMDGWQTLRQLKADRRTKNIPVLMLTGKQLTAAEAKEFNICIEDYLMKPFGKTMLDSAIKSILHRKKNMQSTLALAKKAGVPQDTYCEFAKLSRHVVVNRKMIGILQQTYGVPDPESTRKTESDLVIGQLVTNIREKEDRIEQLRKEISSAFLAKGYPVPSL